MSALFPMHDLPTFQKVISYIKYGRLSKIPADELTAIFTDMIPDSAENPFLKSQFSQYLFLTQPLRDDTYFKTPPAQSSILNLFALDKSKLYQFFFKIDEYLDKYGAQNLNELVTVYDEEFADASKKAVNKDPNLSEPEKESLTRFFDSYINYLESKAYDMNAKMLILFSLINGEAIHLLDAINSVVKFSEERSQFKTNTKYVIQSAMGKNLFIGAENSFEPMNGEDTQRVKRSILYSLSRDMLDLRNAVFEFEEATDEENREDDTISDYGNRKLPVFGDNFYLSKGMKLLMTTGDILHEMAKGSSLAKKKYYIKVGEKYLRFIDWHTESRLLLGKKAKRSRWFIHQNEDKSIVITPSGGLQYYGFCIDIPNATQQTYRIPMWLFFKNGTKAQKFYLHEVLE